MIDSESRVQRAGLERVVLDLGNRANLLQVAVGQAGVQRERQRALGSEGNVVIEGRDIGTVVAPQAQVKVYLVADESVRAARRSSERPGIGTDALATDLRLRDERDAINMRPAEDAVQIDTTDLAVDEVVGRIEEIVAAQRTP